MPLSYLGLSLGSLGGSLKVCHCPFRCHKTKVPLASSPWLYRTHLVLHPGILWPLPLTPATVAATSWGQVSPEGRSLTQLHERKCRGRDAHGAAVGQRGWKLPGKCSSYVDDLGYIACPLRRPQRICITQSNQLITHPWIDFPCFTHHSPDPHCCPLRSLPKINCHTQALVSTSLWGGGCRSLM